MRVFIGFFTVTLLSWRLVFIESEEITVNWSFFCCSEALSVAPGDKITFEWSGNHNLWQFPDQMSYSSCDFTEATEIAGNTGSETVEIMEADADSTLWFGCEIGSHCSNGAMSIIVQVSNDGSSTCNEKKKTKYFFENNKGKTKKRSCNKLKKSKNKVKRNHCNQDVENGAATRCCNTCADFIET